LEPYTGVSEKSFLVTLVLCVLGFVGVAGIHRIYTGKIFTGILFLITGGLFMVGTIYDLVIIVCGGYRSKNGSPLYK